LRAYRSRWPLPAKALAQAVQAIAGAQRPLIYYGGGVVQGNASASLRRLAAVTGAPVTSTLMGLGAFPGDSPQFLGMLGMHCLYEANLAMQHCDVLVAVGARFDDRVIGDPKDFARPRRRIIHVDVDPTSISKQVAVDLPIVGDCAQVVDAIWDGLQAGGHVPRPRSAWHEQIETWRSMRCLDYPQPVNDEIKPQAVIEQLSRMPGAEDFIVTSDVGQHQMWTAQHFRFREPRRWINSGGLGTMGFGLPASLAEAMAARDRLVFLDIAIDRTENVYPTLPPDQPLTRMILRPQVLAEEL
jgi:acetolactate synthase-1/2/3 large subunit